ncbi:CAAX prenyl protease [Collariella sp. IMI 366227]|nr:CAAX prenyl protease [Collariella sp. IMI 366227]
MPALDLFRKLNPWHKGKSITSHPNCNPNPNLNLPFHVTTTTLPSVIRARIRSVTLSCLLCTATTYVVLTRPGIGDSTVPASAAFLRSLFQFAYTTVFGAYATFLYIRSGFGEG